MALRSVAILVALVGCAACGAAAQPVPPPVAALEETSSAPAPERARYVVPVRSVSELTIMSFNLRVATAPDGENHWDHRASLAFEVIRAHRPDVLALQEDNLVQLEQVLDAFPEYAAIGGGADGREGGEHVAILYRMERLDLGERGAFWLSERPDEPGSRGFGASYARLCTWAVLRDRRNDLELVVYNTHLDHRAGDARARGLGLIAAHVREHAGGRPAIVTGDLNLGPEDPALVEFLAEARMFDTYRAVHPERSSEEGTYHGFRGGLDGPRIDFVLATEGARARVAEIVRDHSDDGRYPSDHFPIIATLRLQRSRPADDGSSGSRGGVAVDQAPRAAAR